MILDRGQKLVTQVHDYNAVIVPSWRDDGTYDLVVSHPCVSDQHYWHETVDGLKRLFKREFGLGERIHWTRLHENV